MNNSAVKDQSANELTTQKEIKLFPIRIIPVDIGYKVDSKKLDLIYNRVVAQGYTTTKRIRLFGEDAVLGIECSESLFFYLFADGVGIFSYQDQSIVYTTIEAMDANSILTERRETHKNILNHTHLISYQITRLVDTIRNITAISERRQTSHHTWESGGLSYVMSFYLLDASRCILDCPKVQEWLGNLLFTDRHTYFSSVSDYFENEKKEQILTNIDVLNDIHVCHSWATMIALGDLPKRHRQYYIELEVVLQHIWMFAYITEQHIDMFLEESDKRISSQKLTEFYDTLIDMTLIVKKYDTVISSTVHERELRIFNALKESSKLEILKKGIDEKSQILESKLSWSVDQKRLRSDRNTELFITILTIIQLLNGFGLGVADLLEPKILIPTLICLLVFIVLRMRD